MGVIPCADAFLMMGVFPLRCPPKAYAMSGHNLLYHLFLFKATCKIKTPEILMVPEVLRESPLACQAPFDSRAVRGFAVVRIFC